MTPRTLTAQDIVDYLKSVQAADPDVLHSVLETRYPCGAGILNHPHAVAAELKGAPVFGALGLINGLVVMLGEVLEAQYDADDRLLDFRLRQQPGEPHGETTPTT